MSQNSLKCKERVLKQLRKQIRFVHLSDFLDEQVSLLLHQEIFLSVYSHSLYS